MRFLSRARITSSKVLISTVLTSVIILCQLLLFHYCYRTISSKYTGQQYLRHALKSIYCTHGLLAGVRQLALQSDVELVLIDPDLVESSGQDRWAKEFDEQFSSSKKSQESTHKSILHLAAVNETSGGQPNIKLFFESLKNSGYVTLQYDSSQPMQPEVYRRASHLFDGAHEMHDNQGGEKVSKIYTEFIAHIFVLNRTSNLSQREQNNYECNNGPRNTVIHIFVLYNHEYAPEKQWTQPALVMDELDKHKLLTFNVHWVDFRIPIAHHYLHPKRPIASISIANKNEIHHRPIDSIRVFEPDTERALSYVNNSFVYGEKSPFNIGALIDDQKRYGKYSMMLDNSRPEPEGGPKAHLLNQIDLALQFMGTYSAVYGNFSHWLTGSSLLAYLKFCDLVTVLGDTSAGHDDENSSVRFPMIDLELGVFASEFTATVLEGLANDTSIGVRMISDWRKSDPVIHFKLADCPNVVFRIYPYELRKDFYQHYYITQNSMIFNQKRARKRSAKAKVIDDGCTSWGHHVFGWHNLELCWTQVGGISQPFRVPCNIYDHLRRIYVV